MHFAVAAATLAVAACAGAGLTTTHSTFYDYRYYPNEVRASGAPMPVEVRGAAPGGESAAEVIAALRLPAHVGRATAAAAPGDTGPRLVIGFARASGEALCAPGGGPEGAAKALTVSGAYCVGDQPYTSGIAEAGGASLAATLPNLARVLLPMNNPEHNRLPLSD
jgi:hypothetical protein